MLNGASSAPFAKVNNLLYDFFFSLPLYNKKLLFFRARQLKWPSNFFLLIHMQAEALVLRFIRKQAGEWLICSFECILNCSYLKRQSMVSFTRNSSTTPDRVVTSVAKYVNERDSRKMAAT